MKPNTTGARLLSGEGGAKTTRLYRGLKEPYEASRVSADRPSGTDFTDCPYMALGYASGRRGVLLVLDVPVGYRRLSEELWLIVKAKRFMIWGAFDDFIVAEIPAKELRAEVRRKGMAAADDRDKSMILRRRIADCIKPARGWAPPEDDIRSEPIRVEAPRIGE